MQVGDRVEYAERFLSTLGPVGVEEIAQLRGTVIEVRGSKKKQVDAGVNWWPHPDVVVKADYQKQDNDDGKNQDGFNLGVGYMF